MSMRTSEWLRTFLSRRDLKEPDGRPLYAYRCTQSEFEEISERLGAGRFEAPQTVWDTRTFVLYAAEWWQRCYDGGPWAWEPLLRYIGWSQVHFPDLYQPVRNAFAWWGVELVRLNSSTRYLGTFACQGGLPLSLVGESSRVTAYLRAVLRHVARYRQFVDDSIDLARDQQHLLRPPTLRREYVFRLAADLVDVVIDLQDDVDGEDVLEQLDARRPGWRESMPLDLDSERARNLLAGLLKDAKTGAKTASGFAIERFLQRTGVGWRLGARVRMPRSVTSEELALYLGVPESTLPPRMHVRLGGEGARVVGLYGAGGEEFHLVSGERNRASVFWDEDAAQEFRLEFYAQDVIGEVVVRRGAPLGELPWVFRADEGECAMIGEGSVSDRSPELFVLLLDGCVASHGGALNEQIAGRSLWRITEPTVVYTDCGHCALNPSSQQMAEADYGLSGDRFYGFASPYPLFRGDVRLHAARAEERPRAVPANELSWRAGSGDWQSRPDGFGLWEVRHVKHEVLQHHDRLGLLPPSLKLSIHPGSDLGNGELALHGAIGVGVADDGSEARLDVTPMADGARIRATALDPTAPPAEVALRLHWVGARELRLQAPFPCEGARFLRNGRPVDGSLAVDDLYGVRVTALSIDEVQQFWIEGELKAGDTWNVRKVAYFRQALRKSGMRHELALMETDSMLRLLLGASAAPDARVVLRIVDRHQVEHDAIEVRRFTGMLEHDPTMASILVTPPLDGSGRPTFEALPLARPDLEPVNLPTVGPEDSPVCAMLPDAVRSTDEPWLVVLRQDDDVRVEPVVVGGRSLRPGATHEPLPLAEAASLADSKQRALKVEEALNRMSEEEHGDAMEADWSFLTDMLLCLEDVSPTSAELISVLPRCTRTLVRCLFRMDPNLRRRIWRLDEELPFSWLMVRRNIWRSEATLAYEAVRSEMDGIVAKPEREAAGYILAILGEGVQRLAALDTIGTDLEMYFAGGALGEAFETSVREERDTRMREHVQRLAREDDWPPGDSRREWSDELEHGKLIAKLQMWQREDIRSRLPTLDTPVAAAWCCFFSNPTARTVFLVKRMRAHAPDWFDIAYSAAWYRLARLLDEREEATT